MINKVLIANRGEIAVRIIRTLREMGIKSVAIYSDVDRESLHVKLADESICIGPRSVGESYLNKVQVINAAIVTGADAIHPGFGFLSENPNFAKMCEIYGMKFIGPSSKVIELMGNKDEAKRLMRSISVPVVEGSDGVVDNYEDLEEIAEKIGYPVIIKARSGGGGKGMRVVYNRCDLNESYKSAQKEASNAFGDDGVYIEKYIQLPRHIEVQIMCDEYGNAIHLGARDCSIQMNHQKIIEEAPPVNLDESILEKLYDYAVKAASKVGYTNVGTVEFLISKNGEIFFMEMNTRIQVEHPITEMITGVDIVREQINIANKKPLSFTQDDIKIKGHSIECRINAYDYENNFMPSVGEIEELFLPGGRSVRVDSAIYQGYKILPFYDSMIAKIIVYGDDREQAISIMERSLKEVVIEGVKTNTKFNKDIMNDDKFKGGKYDTSFLSDFNVKK